MTRTFAVLALVVAVLGLASCSESGSKPPLSIGSEAPAFELDDLQGSPVASSAYAGGPVLINFWATWCRPCLREKPELEALARGGEVAVVAIALDEKGAETVGPFVDRHRPPYDVLLGNRETFQRFSGYTIPYSLLVGSEGTILEIYRGPVTRQQVERDLAAATPAAS